MAMFRIAEFSRTGTLTVSTQTTITTTRSKTQAELLAITPEYLVDDCTSKVLRWSLLSRTGTKEDEGMSARWKKGSKSHGHERRTRYN
jgi:hypothetical protein